MTGEEISIINILDGGFVSVPRTELIGKLLNIPRSAICKHLAQLSAKVLFPLVLAHNHDKVSVFVLFYFVCHFVRKFEIFYCLDPWKFISEYRLALNTCIEKPTVWNTKIFPIKDHHV